MDIQGSKILVLGGYGLVGTAVCRELLTRKPREIRIHSLRAEEAEAARAELAAEAAEARVALTVTAGDLFGLADPGVDPRSRRRAHFAQLDDESLERFWVYSELASCRPDVVVDCVNTATGIAYRDMFSAAEELDRLTSDGFPGGGASTATPEAIREGIDRLLGTLYIPRLIRHLQVMFRAMTDAGTRAYAKVGTTGTGGMGLNIPYTHSEERPSRTLLAKSAIAGAHSMLLTLLARTPGAPAVTEIKPAAAIAWKKIGYGPIVRKRETLHRVEAAPRPIGGVFSTADPSAARVLDQPLESVYIDTGENGVFSLEEFATVSSVGQMEFVTPEEIAAYLVMEIEGRSTGTDVVGALDGAILGPTYRAAALRHEAIERMIELEREHGVRSVAFEMLGPPRISKLLYEAHLLREAFATLREVAAATPEAVRDRLDALVRARPEVANEAAAVGIPVLLDSGELIRGVKVIVPQDADRVAVTPENLERWVRDGWADLRLANCRLWIDRARRILAEIEAIPPTETSSRHVRTRRYWLDGGAIQPGKTVGWILSVEERGERIKR